MTFPSFRLAAALAGATLLAGCATSPPLVMLAPPARAEPHQIGWTLAHAQSLQQAYKARYDRHGKLQGVLQLPLIGLAAAGAAVVVSGPASASATLGYLGIGGAAYGATRTTLSPATLPTLYVQGFGALQCVQNEAPLFLPNNDAYVGSPLAQFAAARATLARTIATAEATEINTLMEDEPKARPERQAELILARAAMVNARARLSATLAAARIALAAADRDLAAGAVAGPIFASAISNTADRVASKGQIKADNYQDYLKTFTPAAPASPDQDAGRNLQSKTAVATLASQNEDLTTAMAGLAARSRPYADAIARVKNCPDLVK